MTMKILAAAALTALVAVPAFAQAQGGGAGAIVTQLVPLVLIFAIMYFLLIRPQQKKAKEHKSLLEALSKGDEVVTASGMAGRVTKVGDDFVTIEIAANVEVQMQKPAISVVLPKGTLKNL